MIHESFKPQVDTANVVDNYFELWFVRIPCSVKSVSAYCPKLLKLFCVSSFETNENLL